MLCYFINKCNRMHLFIIFTVRGWRCACWNGITLAYLCDGRVIPMVILILFLILSERDIIRVIILLFRILNGKLVLRVNFVLFLILIIRRSWSTWLRSLLFLKQFLFASYDYLEQHSNLMWIFTSIKSLLQPSNFFPEDARNVVGCKLTK